MIDDNTIIKVEEIVSPNGEIDLYLKLIPDESSGKKKMTINELAKIVQEGFIQVNARLDRVEQMLDEHSDIFKRNNLK